MGCSFLTINSYAIERVSSGFKHSRPLNFSSTSCPLTSTCGARPGEKIKSLMWPPLLSMAAISCGTPKVRCLDSAEDVSGGALVTVVVVPMVGKLVEKLDCGEKGNTPSTCP